MYHLTIFASGGGSNAREICKYFQDHPAIRVGLIITNKEKAGVLDIAKAFDIPAYTLSGKELSDERFMLDLLGKYHIDYIALAGYLKLIPSWLIAAFPGRILNIHPSLLPKYGGKGMYGIHVHEAVKAHKEAESGMTVHLVNEAFDKGRILFQAKTRLTEDMTPADIAATVLALEHQYYSAAIEKFVLGQ